MWDFQNVKGEPPHHAFSLLVRLKISIYPNINNLGANTNKGWLQVKENNKMEKNFENHC
jgi:hypothetical protein